MVPFFFRNLFRCLGSVPLFVVPFFFRNLFRCLGSVPLFVVPSTMKEELIIASNLANRVLRSFSSCAPK